jgi:hypothetical protein
MEDAVRETAADTRRERLALEHHAAALLQHEVDIDQQLKRVERQIDEALQSGVGAQSMPPPDARLPPHWGQAPAAQTSELRELPIEAWIDQRVEAVNYPHPEQSSADNIVRQQQLQELMRDVGLDMQSGAHEVDERDRLAEDMGFPTVVSWNSEGYDQLPFDEETAELLDLDLDGAQDYDALDLPAMPTSAEELASLIKDSEDLRRATSTDLATGMLGPFIKMEAGSTGDVAGHQGLADSLSAQQRAALVGPSVDTLIQLRAINKRKAEEELSKDNKQPLVDAARTLHCSFAGCNYKASKPRYLREHERVHTGERPYKCPWPGCTYAAAGQGHISRHIRTHTGVKPYACKEPGCTYATSQSGHLRTHMRTHSGERPFKCTVPGCTYAAGRRGHLLRHIKARHSAAASGAASGDAMTPTA